MRSLIRRNRPARTDPAPSRWAWRMQRLMLTPGFLLAMRVGLPFAAALGAGSYYLSDEANRAAIRDSVAQARAAIEERPEFMVHLMAIDGAESPLADDIRAALPLDFPVSSFDLDIADIRATITGLDPVRDASVRIRPGGVLQIDVEPRVPAVIWRTVEGLNLLDASGALVSPIARRALRADLPVIAGAGADAHVDEALTLVRAAAPLGARLRGLVRMGDRRWDIVLDRNQRILLPEAHPVRALERVIALDHATDVLARDVAWVDMRLARRPTLRMTDAATEEWWRIRQSAPARY